MTKKTAAELLPPGWIRAGSHPNQYEMGVDPNEKHSGSRSGYMKCITPKPGGFGTLMQMFEAGEMKDKRYRLTGWTKAAGVSGWAGMWMRVDGPAKGKSLAFDNMRDRPIQGTEDWTKHEIVLDVPESATYVAFGVLLNGDGQIWMDDFEFEEVEKGVSTTGDGGGVGRYPKTFSNMSFED